MSAMEHIERRNAQKHLQLSIIDNCIVSSKHVVPNFLTIEEVSVLLNVPSSTLRKWAKDKRIPCSKIGKKWRFERREIEIWLLKQKRSSV